MAKKRKPIEPDADGILRTGIWQRRVVPKMLPAAEAQEQLEKSLASSRTINAWLNDWIKCCAEVIRPHLDDSGRTSYALNLGDGWQGYRLADDLPEVARDAIDCMNEARVLMLHVDDDDSLSGSLHFAINAAFRLGRMTERMQVRQFEPAALSGRKVSGGGTKGANVVNEDHVELHAEYQPKVDALIAEGYSYTKATEELAARLGVSGRTVRNNTTNPAPRNSGRSR